MHKRLPSGRSGTADVPSRSPDRARIYIVDDHAVVREGLSELIQRDPELQVCGAAATAGEGLAEIRKLLPDLAIVDLSLGVRGGMELIASLHSECPQVSTLVLSMHDEGLHAERALRAGARGYIMKQEAMPDLRNAIRTVLSGGIYLSPGMSQQLIERLARGPSRSGPLDRLTSRQRDIYDLIGRGVATREIARDLSLSVKTVESHRAAIIKKLGLQSGAELVRHAISSSTGR